MIQNNNFSVLPFYTSKAFWYSNRPESFGELYPLITPNGYFPTFQFTLPGDYPQLDVCDFRLFNADGEFVLNVTSALIEAGLSTAVSTLNPEYTTFIYSAAEPYTLDLPEGSYYLRMSFPNGIEIYSEIFTIVNDISDCIEISWWDDEDLYFDAGYILYQNAFRHKLYLKAGLGRPSYEYDEEGTTRSGYYFAEKQVSEKVYKFTFVAPEFLCDAIRFIRISDNVVVKYLGKTYNCDSFLPSFDWLEQGDLAGVEVEFKTNTVVKKIATGFSRHKVGQFNGDYNPDFDNV